MYSLLGNWGLFEVYVTCLNLCTVIYKWACRVFGYLIWSCTSCAKEVVLRVMIQ